MTTKNAFSAAVLAIKLILVVILFWVGGASAQSRKPMDAGQDMSFLADSNVLTKSDYLFHLEKVFEVVNKVPVTITSFTKLIPIQRHLEQDEAALTLLKSRLTQNDRQLNLQNLQMD